MKKIKQYVCVGGGRCRGVFMMILQHEKKQLKVKKEMIAVILY